MSDRIEHLVELMKVQPGDRVLEIGCGHGVAAAMICSKLVDGSFLAIDRSQKMVEAAAKRNEAFVKAGLAQFIMADLESADLGERMFDKVLAMRVCASSIQNRSKPNNLPCDGSRRRGNYSFNTTSRKKSQSGSQKMCAFKAAPNPSIEGMPKRLRLLCTPHVKR
jgi:SAM-dependent methyltransferase